MSNSLREGYLNILCKEQVDSYIYLVNGIKLQGKIQAFDEEAILLKNTITQIVLKHAISTVVPAGNIDLSSISS